MQSEFHSFDLLQTQQSRQLLQNVFCFEKSHFAQAEGCRCTRACEPLTEAIKQALQGHLGLAIAIDHQRCTTCVNAYAFDIGFEVLLMQIQHDREVTISQSTLTDTELWCSRCM